MVSPFFKQAWTVSAVLINMVAQGMLLSFTTSLLPALSSPDSSIQADLNTASWLCKKTICILTKKLLAIFFTLKGCNERRWEILTINSYLASLGGISGIPGFFLSSALMDVFGRKIAHFLVILPGMVGWTIIYFAKDIPALMIGRILSGMTAGATVSLGAIVIGEYTSPKYRGVFLNLKTAAVSTGSMMVHILGHFYGWRTIALQALVPHVIALFMIITWPESPAWLASKEQFQQSEKSFYWLRGKSEESFRELNEMIKAQMDALSKQQTSTFIEKTREFSKKFTRRDFVKPALIILVGVILLEMCGRHIFPAYALQIIGEITDSKSQSFYYTLCIDVIITASAVFSSILVKIMKRRTLLFSTGLAAFLVLMSACTYLFLVARDVVSKDYTWIPISLFVIYFILVNLGCTPIPLALLGELYPLDHRGVGSVVSGVCISVCVMAGLQMTPYLLLSIKVYGTFAVYGVAMGVALSVLYFTLPETKDRTLLEIEEYFNCGRFRDVKEDKEDEAKVKMIA